MSEKQKTLKARLLALARKRKFKKEFRDEDAGVGLPPLTKGEIAEMKLEEKREKKRDKIAKEKKLKQPSRLLNPYKRGGGLPDSVFEEFKKQMEKKEKRKKKQPSKRLRPGGGAGIPNRLLKGGLNNFRNRIK